MSSIPLQLAIILDQPEIGLEWKSWLTYELALRGLTLGTDGTIEEHGSLIGFFQFLEPSESETLLRQAGVETPSRECPWVGRVRGAIGWEGIGSMEDLLRSFLPLVIRLGKGPLLRTRDGAHQAPFRQVKFSLSQLTSKFGFADGDAFLDRSAPYLEYAQREARGALDRAGLEGELMLFETIHNPLRLRGPVTRNGKTVSDTALQDISMTLWAFDWGCLQEVMFW